MSARGRGREPAPRPGRGRDQCEEVIILDDEEPTLVNNNTQEANAGRTSTKIAITIEDSLPRMKPPNSSTKITISIEDSDLETSTNISPTKKHTLPTENSSKSKIRRVELVSPPNNDKHEPNAPDCDSKYEEFVQLCSLLESSSDMQQVIEKKIKRYYCKADKSYTQSKEFNDMLVHKMNLLRCDPSNMWKNIKDVVDAMKLRKRENESEIIKPELLDPEKRQKVIHLERAMRHMQRSIQRLEAQEVNFDDDNTSAYLIADNCKATLVRMHAKLCALTGMKVSSYARVKIAQREGRPGGAAARLEAWINRPMEHGEPPPFPDFHDVLQCVRDANREDQLMWTKPQVMQEARDLFTQCGRALQQRRQRREWRLVASLLETDVDPAESSPELQATLAKNRLIAQRREAQIIDKFADQEKFSKTKSNLANNTICENESSSEEQIENPEESTENPQQENKSELVINNYHNNVSSDKEIESPELPNATFDQENKSKVTNYNNIDNASSIEKQKEISEENEPTKGLDEISAVVNMSAVKSESDKESYAINELDAQVLNGNELSTSGYEVVVSDSDDFGSDIDELKLLRKTDEVLVLSDDDTKSSELYALREIEKSGAEYSTDVYGIESDTDYEIVDLSDISDGSDCVLVQSDKSSDEDSSTDDEVEQLA